MEQNRDRTRKGNQRGNGQIRAAVRAQQGSACRGAVVNPQIVVGLFHIHRTMNCDVVAIHFGIDSQRSLAVVTIVARSTAIVVNHTRTGGDAGMTRQRHVIRTRQNGDRA